MESSSHGGREIPSQQNYHSIGLPYRTQYKDKIINFKMVTDYRALNFKHGAPSEHRVLMTYWPRAYESSLPSTMSEALNILQEAT